MFSFSVSAFARRAADNSHSGRQAAEVDPNKKKNTRKTKAGIKVQWASLERKKVKCAATNERLSSAEVTKGTFGAETL